MKKKLTSHHFAVSKFQVVRRVGSRKDDVMSICCTGSRGCILWSGVLNTNNNSKQLYIAI
jgi:hypothetical protein